MTSAETAKGNLRLQAQLTKSQYCAELLEAAGGSMTAELSELYSQFCTRIDEITAVAEREIDGMEALYNAPSTTIETNRHCPPPERLTVASYGIPGPLPPLDNLPPFNSPR